jgi:hypothetical protein
MSCKDCHWYCKERRHCVKHGKFEFETMPVCEDFKQDEGVEVLPKEGK